MREINTHALNDRQPELFAGPNIAPGNAPQEYRIHVQSACWNTGYNLPINFISLEENGVTNEVLLAIVIDRLEGFQSGPFACDGNQKALDACRASLEALHERTRERLARGVENKHAK